jgi:uncharacterized membrane protein YcgQ (UPF0703/DUF1980 family)
MGQKMTEEKNNDETISEEVVYDDIIEKTLDKVMDRTGIYVEGDERQSVLNIIKKKLPGYESKVIELPGKCVRENKKPSNNILIIVALNLIISITSLYIYHCYILKPVKNNQNIVGVDIKAFLENQKKGMVEGKITEEQFKANMDKLEATVNDLGKTKVVLMGDVILRGAQIVDVQ